MNDYKPTLYLVRGLPGAGKSTFARKLAYCMDIGYYEADMYFMHEGEYKFNPSGLTNAHAWCQGAVKCQLELGLSVVVSNTSTTEHEVQTYKDIAEQYGANFVSLIVENRHGSSSVHDVPAGVIQRMQSRFSIKL